MPFNVFGGGVAQPSDVSYRAVALSANVTLVWPSLSESSTDVVSRIMDVTPSGAGLEITMPDARQRTEGQDVLFRNLGSDTFTVKDSAGGTIGTVSAGVSKYVYLVDNSTQAGSWQVVTFGTGTSSADAATLAGYGLKAIGITLNQKHDVSETTSDPTITDSDRAKTYVWTSGNHTCTLPTAGSVGSDFFFIAKNAGSGTITISRSGGDTIDGATSVQLAPNDGMILYSAGGANRWYTIAQGRSVSFAFTQLVKNVGGSSDVTLTSAECANKVMSFTGALTGNINVIVTNTVSVYYVYNNTSGAFTLTVKTAAGTGIVVTQGTRDILVCDATNVMQAISNTVASTIFSAGSESAPSITFVGDTNTGFYQNAADKPAVTAGGTDVMRWNTASSAVNAIDVFPSATGSAPYLVPFGGDANVSLGLRPLGTGTGIVIQNAAGTGLLAGNNTAVQLDATVPIGWGSGAVLAGANEVELHRDAANTLALRRAASPQAFRVYNTYTDASNYERLSMYWAANVAYIEPQGAGTGTQRALVAGTTGADHFYLQTNGVSRWRVAHTTGNLEAQIDNSYDIGASSANRPRTGYFGTNVIIGPVTDGTYTYLLTGSVASAANGTGGYGIFTSDSVLLSMYRRAGGLGELIQLIAGHSSITQMNIGGGAVGALGSGITFNTDNSLTQFRIAHTASAVNYVNVTGSATGNYVQIGAAGSDTNVGMTIASKGTSTIDLYTGGGLQLRVANTNSAVNYLQATGSATGNVVALSAQGTDSNVGIYITAKGSAGVALNTGGGQQFLAGHVASAVNYLIAQGGSTGNPVNLSAGGETNVGLFLSSKGTGQVIVQTGGGAQVCVNDTASAVNYVQLTGGATGSPGIVTISSQGSDSNVDLQITPKGTGVARVSGTLEITGASIPQNSQSTAYTLVAADANKHILHPSADTTARTFTIPANASVAFSIGTAVTFVNQNSAGVLTIAITTDTMRLAGAGTTGSRTLAANGIATALKITATEWIISGTGLT